MKRYALNNLGRALIVLLIVSAVSFISACAKPLQQAGNGGFYPEYFVSKKLDKADIIKLREFASSTNLFVSNSATLILGDYYLKNGDKSYGKVLIDKSYADKSLDYEMSLFGKLWKMDALLIDKNEAAARAIAEDIKSMEGSVAYDKVLKTYCINADYFLSDEEDARRCVDMRFYRADMDSKATVAAPAPTDEKYSSMTYDEYIRSMGLAPADSFVEGQAVEEVKEAKGDISKYIGAESQINIVSSAVGSDVEKGMMYALSKFGDKFSLSNVSVEDMGGLSKNDLVVNLLDMSVSAGENKVEFGTDWDSLLKVAGSLKSMQGYRVVVICTSENDIPLGNALKSTLGSRKIESTILNFQNPNFQTNLKNLLTKYQGSKVLIAGVGYADELRNFLSIAKFLQSDKELEKVLLISDAVGDVGNNSEYSAYYRDVYVLTPVQTYASESAKEISDDFMAFFGTDMNGKNILGYDLIVYLHNIAHPNDNIAYISNVSSIYDGRMERPIGLYYFTRKLEIKEMPISLVDTE